MHLQLDTSFETCKHFEVETYLNTGFSLRVYTILGAKDGTVFDVGTPSFIWVPALWSVLDSKVMRGKFMFEIANDINFVITSFLIK